MQPITFYPYIEQSAYTINNSKDVNPWPMQDVRVQLVNGELMIYMRGEVGPNGELPGALVGFAVPSVSKRYAGFNHEMRIDECSSALLECWECDLKWCVNPATSPDTPIPNVVDGSLQKLYSKNGMWQIDDKTRPTPNWADSGYKPGKFPVNQWNKIASRMSFNSDSTFSMTSITDGGSTYQVPATWNGVPLQNLPVLNTNWTQTGAQFQIVLKQSGFVVVWVRNASALFSDMPIPV